MKKACLLLFISIGSFLFLFLNLNGALAQSGETAAPQDQITSANPQTLPLNTNPDVPHNLTTYTQSVFIELTSAASCILAGVDPIRPSQPCLGIDPETNKLGYVKGSAGLTGMMGNFIASTFSIPASSGEYFRYLARNFGVTQEATAGTIISPEFCDSNPEICVACDLEPEKCEVGGEGNNLGFATGNGYEGLKPVLGIWTAIRNIVYLLFVLIFIVLGLGIMFRLQVDPRAVLSIQSQLPKIIIALIFVTFSYAIAGFLVDMMYLSLFLIINIFQGQGLEVSTTLATNPISAAGGMGGVGGIATDAAKGIATVVTSIFDGSWGSAFKGIINVVFGALSGITNPTGLATTAGGAVAGGIAGSFIPIPGIGTITGALIGASLAGIVAGLFTGGPEPFTLIAGAIAWLIIVIAVLTALFRLWFILIKTYVFILIDIIFAPLWIAFGLFPGSSLSLGSWIRSLVANLSAFPIVLVLFSLGQTLQKGFIEGNPATNFVPPYVGDPGSPGVFASLIGLGIILLAPEAVNMAKAALKAPQFGYGSAIGRSLSAGSGLVTKPISGTAGQLFGEDAMGRPKVLTKLATERGGRALGFLFGGGLNLHHQPDDPEARRWFRNPFRRRTPPTV